MHTFVYLQTRRNSTHTSIRICGIYRAIRPTLSRNIYSHWNEEKKNTAVKYYIMAFINYLYMNACWSPCEPEEFSVDRRECGEKFYISIPTSCTMVQSRLRLMVGNKTLLSCCWPLSVRTKINKDTIYTLWSNNIIIARCVLWIKNNNYRYGKLNCR